MSAQRDLDDLAEEIRAHKGAGCGFEVCETCTQLVPGIGPASAEIVIVGEAPGAREDAAGVPFVGAAGRLLDTLLAEAGIPREAVFITNVVKARPPRNRDPKKDEVAHHWPWLERQLEIIRPQLLVPLGRHALARFAPGREDRRGPRRAAGGRGRAPRCSRSTTPPPRSTTAACAPPCSRTHRRCAPRCRRTRGMSTTTRALHATAAKAPFEATTIERRDLKPTDVAIDIAYCGICHTDIHQRDNDWGRAQFPIVPGHEITGIVSAVGDDVTRHQVGDRVGVGCFVDSCGECEPCVEGDEHFCVKGAVATYNSTGYDGERTFGGYSQHDRRRRALRDPDPGRARPRRRGAAAVRRHHHVQPAQALGRGAGQAAWRSSGWAASATSACRSPPSSAPR